MTADAPPLEAPWWLETARFSAVSVAFGVLALALRHAPAPSEFRVATSCSAPVAEHPDVQWIEQDEARALVDDASVIFVDARSHTAFEAGHVPNALSMPMDLGVLDAERVPALHDARMVVAYCDTDDDCAASRRLAGLLVENGLRDVRVLRGGMPLWLSNDFPAESGP